MRTFQSAEDCLNEALGMITQPGAALEFGVADGHSLRRIVAAMPTGSSVIGFDSFEGLPEHWREGFGRGMFRTSAPEVPGAEIVVGLFSELRGHIAPDDVVLVHIDCDLYSSTLEALTYLGPALRPGCLVVFDEYHGYPGSEQHEERAWLEWVGLTGLSWTVLAEGPEQLLIRIEEAPVKPSTPLHQSSHDPRGYDRQPGPRR